MKLYYLSNARLPTEKAHGLAVMKTCEALAMAGHDVELIVPRRRNTLTEDPFSYYRLKTRFPLRRLFTLDLIFLGRIGFLVQEISFAVAAAFYLRRKTGIIYSRDDIVLFFLYLFGYRSFVWESHTGAWNPGARSVARYARALVVISQGLKDFYTERGIPESKISVVPSAIDVEQFARPEERRSARTRLGLPQEAKIAMYIGRLDGWKGSSTLLDASKFLGDIKTVVIGGEKEQVERLKAQYPEVLFLGFRPYSELADNQSAADVLVVPNTGKDVISARYTSPLKVVAHMASGRPIVASDLPSIREIVGDDGAYLVQADNPKALAEGIEAVLVNEVLGETLAKRALEKVEKYTWTARAAMIGKLIASI